MDYIYPNEVNVVWTVMIVLYPYITGLVAGAFIVSSLYHVFGREDLKPVARFSLVSAFVFLLFATAPLLVHLGRPERAFNIMLTPNFSSAMAGFGYIYSFYLILVTLEIWFVMRSDFIRIGRGKGVRAGLCRAIVLFDLHEDEASKNADKKIIRFLAGLGIPSACLLHGYVGFLFGSLKANPWWNTPLMLVIFIFSAIVSGISILIFLYFVIHKLYGWQVDQKCVRALGKWLWGFMIFAVALELLEVLSLAYKQTEEWEILRGLIKSKLMVSYIYLQFLTFSLIPFLMLAATALFKLKDKVTNALIFTAATMLLCQVLLMRWNVVIGGQLLSKSLRGFTDYLPGIFEREGLLIAAIILIIPFIILRFFHGMVPLFPNPVKKAKPASAAEESAAASGD